MLDKLRTYVKDRSCVDWTREQVKGKIQYAKKNPARNPPPVHQSVNYPGDRTLDLESEEETDNLESGSDDDLIIEPSREQSIVSSVDKGKGAASKRQKTPRAKYISLDELKYRMDDIRALGSGGGSSVELEKERMKQLARREQVLEERESSWTARWFEMERQLEEKLKRRSEEHGSELKKQSEEHEAQRKRQSEEHEAQLKKRTQEAE
ncbi:hypothetical protein BGZ83_004833, partial [Gryganskiella cystojenkinii]